MLRIRMFVRRSFVGGVLVLGPLVILGFFFHWLFYALTDLIQPLTVYFISRLGLPELAGDFLVILLIALTCFVTGSLVSTGAGRWLHLYFDKYLIKLAPGYRMISEILKQFLSGSAQSPFAQAGVAKAYIFGREVNTYVTGLITSRHADGSFTVFVPSGPNPTSGYMYHLPAQQVELLEGVKLDAALRTIIACGAGSAELFAGNKTLSEMEKE